MTIKESLKLAETIQSGHVKEPDYCAALKAVDALRVLAGAYQREKLISAKIRREFDDANQRLNKLINSF